MDDRLKTPVAVSDFTKYPNASYSATSKLEPSVKNEQEIKTKPIVSSSKVTIKKQSSWKKAKHRIFEQEKEEMKDYALNQVIFPTLKDTLSDLVANLMDILLFGEPRHTGVRKSGGILSSGGIRYGNYVSYNSVNSFKPGNSSYSRSGTGYSTNRNYLPIDEFIFDNKEDADNVLDCISTICQDDGVVSVADLYGCIKDKDGRPIICPHTYTYFGWVDLSTATVKRNPGGGWLLSMPTPLDVRGR